MDQKQLIGYLEGKTTGIDSWRVQEWLHKHDSEKEVREMLSDIWNYAEIKINDTPPDFEIILNQLHHLINLSEIPKATESQLHKLYRYFSKAAAILIIPIVLVAGYYMINDQIESKQEPLALERTITTKPGSRTMVDLPDGTRVWLNDETTLKYPDRFRKNERRVFIDGEAYFEVVANEKQPFIVENPMLDVRVTGTKFNLSAYCEDNYFEATLLEGKIFAEKGPFKKEIEPGYQLQVDQRKNKQSYGKVDPSISNAWIGGRLILQNEPLDIAIRKLSRWYNVEFIIQSPELNEYLLTATIQDEKPEQTIKLIAFALPVRYTIKTTRVGNDVKRTIYLMKK